MLVQDMFDTARFWWERDDLRYQDGRLFFGERDLASWIDTAETPCFIYSADAIRANLERMANALTGQGVRHRIFFAVKSNRFAPNLAYLRLTNLCGIDTCSPNEVRLARSFGFSDTDISFTGSSLSNQDLDFIAKRPDLLFIADSISAIRRMGERCPGRTIGIRVNLSMGAGYNPTLHYAGEKPTKFGVYREQFAQALEMAAAYNLHIKALHFHSGSGYLTPQLENFDRILQGCGWFLDQCPTVDTLDVGGGLGVPLSPLDEPLDMTRWASIIAKHALPRNLTVHVEPGDYLVKNAGMLIAEVNMVERKHSVTFVGVNAGLNMQPLTVYYKIPAEPAPLERRAGDPQPVTIVGNINESIDVLAEDVLLPPLAEGDKIAFLNLGGYAATMSSNHCMRGGFGEFFIPPRVR
jgi:diaminopimelate decarboxylase